ncbi:hypothetical protein [Sphingomonas sp. MMS24-J13]|uniref:hypothetical protein n=1 Tax=Sphingomonas sp. MMS24-J13 TaxID=3238686 RepID=UPI00384D1A1E
MTTIADQLGLARQSVAPMPTTPPQRWCILRTSPGRTLSLAKSLAGAGFTIWTPSEVQTRRRPRTRTVREVDAPILPSFVFASADRVHDLRRITMLEMSPHPQFSIFQHGGKVPLIAERELARLRAEEADAQRRSALKRAERARRERGARPKAAIPIGQKVDGTGPWSGLTGTVTECDGRTAIVLFGGILPVTIDAWKLASGEVIAA